MLPAAVQTKRRLSPTRNQGPDGKLRGALPASIPSINPLLGSIRLAKIEIARVLSKAENLDNLRVALQTQFDEDPTLFLRTYEPLFRVYEADRFGNAAPPLERRPLRIIVKEGGTVNVDKKEEIIMSGDPVRRVDNGLDDNEERSEREDE